MLPRGTDDDRVAADLLGAAVHIWDDPSVDWHAFDRVVIRSTWDYSTQVQRFLDWTTTVGPDRLRNVPEVVAWNTDKRYLGELSVPAAPTTFIAPGEPPPELDGEVVVKPSVSAGARDTGRFSATTHDQAHALIAHITDSGRTALVQPYLASVDHHGETALVFLGGSFSHALHKRAVLSPDEVAPVAPEFRGAARVMLDPDLVTASTATALQREHAEAVIEEVAARFGAPPLYARVDLAAGDDGEPRLMEVELVEPALYLRTTPGAAERFAHAVRSSVT
jgi:hypothetical protein